MTEFTDTIARSGAWLLRQQSSNGGWGEQRGRYTNVMNTAEAIVGLLDADNPQARPGAQSIQKAVAYLLARQSNDSESDGCWLRAVTSEGPTPAEVAQVPDVCRTAIVLEAIIRAGVGIDKKPVTRGITWLLKIANQDHGWGFGVGDTFEYFSHLPCPRGPDRGKKRGVA
jgi:squalene cyclase